MLKVWHDEIAIRESLEEQMMTTLAKAEAQIAEIRLKVMKEGKDYYPAMELLIESRKQPSLTWKILLSTNTTLDDDDDDYDVYTT